MSKYLFIAAHTDDEVCFAATMVKLIEAGHYVQLCTMSWCGRPDLMDECLASSKILGVHLWRNNFRVREFSNHRKEIADYFYTIRNYDVVFTHSPYDRHPDHRTVAEESKRVFNKSLLTFIGPWNGEENANYYIEIDQLQLDKKIEAIKCYASQSNRHYMNEDFIRSWARYNGVKIGKQYAEAYNLVKGIDFVDISSGFSNGTLRKAAQPLEDGDRY